MNELMTQEQFILRVVEAVKDGYEHGVHNQGLNYQSIKTIGSPVSAAYDAALARIATLEAELAAKQEQIERLLAECAHS